MADQDDAYEALMSKIAEMVPHTVHAYQVRDLAEAYAWLVSPGQPLVRLHPEGVA